MLTQDDMSRLQAEEHCLIEPGESRTPEEYVLQLMHEFPYQRARQLAESTKVLDLGCNTGYGTEILAGAAKEVVGVDVSQKAILAARAKYGRPGLRFEVVDGNRLPFQDGEFDVIVSFQVIEHVVDYGKYVVELKRVLSPAGIALFTTPNARLRLDPGMRPWNRLHSREFDAPGLRSLLQGFFPAVEILGLFAREHFYAVEHDRVQRALRMWRIGRYMPPFMLSAARRTRSRLASLLRKQQPGSLKDRGFADRYSLDDMSYRQGDLSSALDLMAACGRDVTSLRAPVARLAD